jgi:hypothetical protein
MAMMVETSKRIVPMMPELFFRYFLPNNPNKTNPASGSSGINAM